MSNSLTIDIGNTTISFGVFSGKKIVRHFKLLTYQKNIAQAIRKIKTKDISKIIICSVAPSKNRELKGLLAKIFKKKVLVTGKDIIVPIKNKYRIPRQVGQDRLVNAYAGLKLFGPGLIIVDFGTAVTFDVVSKKGEYLGGLIFPGIDLSLDALYLKTALLPRVKIEKPKSLVGRDTKGSIINGIVFGMAGVCDEIIERLQNEYKDYKVISTGGNVNFIKLYSKKVKIIRPFLTLEGLNFLSN